MLLPISEYVPRYIQKESVMNLLLNQKLFVVLLTTGFLVLTAGSIAIFGW